jgi:4-amino-4-deoxy-L-arabinose transferase-like glycosyltransferase
MEEGAAAFFSPPLPFAISTRLIRALPTLLLIPALLLGIVLRLELLATRSLWIDEALSLDIASAGPSGIVAISRSLEPHPPGYYLLLWTWQRVFGEGFVTARVLSTLLGLAAVVLAWALGRRMGGDWIGLGAAVLVALHPFQIFSSNEVRMYPMLTVLGLGASLALARALSKPEELRGWALYGVLAAAIGYTSYYGFLLLAGHLAVVLVTTPRTGWRGPAVAAAVAVLSYAPWLPSLLPSVTSNPVPWRPVPPWWYPVSILTVQTFGGHVLGTPSYHASPPPTTWWFLLLSPFVLLLAVGAGEAWKREPAGRLVVTSWILPVALVLAASLALRKVAAYNYHLTFLQPYAAVLIAYGTAGAVRGAPRRVRGWLTWAVGVVVIGCLASAVWIMQTGSGEVYRFDLVARLLREQQRAGDVTLYFTQTGQRVLRRYYSPRGPEIAVAPSPHRWTLEDTRPLLHRAAEPLTGRYRRVWLILTPPFPPGSAEELLSLLRNRGFREPRGGVSFGGVFVVLLER